MYQVTNVYFICGLAAIGGGLFGFDISSMSGIIGTQAYKNYFGNPISYWQGGITACMPAGSLLGCLFSSFIADRFSRKYAIQLACLLWIFGSIMQCLSNGVVMLCAGRVIAGVCVGIASAIVPIYQSEIAPKEIRGRVVSLQQWAVSWGILIQFFVQYGAAQVGGGPDDLYQPTAAFRIPWGIQTIPAIILFVGLFFCPFSPRWLASRGMWDEALEVLARLHGNGNKENTHVKAQYREIQEALRLEKLRLDSCCEAFKQPRILRRVGLGISIQSWSQLCGLQIMMYYIVYIMEGAQIASPLVIAAIECIINVVLTLPAILYIDKVGRRPALIGGSFFMMIFMFITGALQAVYGQPNDGTGSKDISWIVKDNIAASKAIVATTYLFVATFSTTWGPTSWAYAAEIFPSKVRAKAVSISTAANWFWNMVLAFAVPPLLWAINWKTYMVFAAFNGVACIHMALMAHETKGYSLEEMDFVFDGGVPAWKSRAKKNMAAGRELVHLRRDT